MEANVDDPDSDEDLKAKIADAQGFIEALEGGNIHVGTPFEGRTEAKIFDPRRQIATYRSIIDQRHAHRT
jgi:hypothetical protein